MKPSRAASASRRLDPADPADLAGEADLADRHQVVGQRGVAGGARPAPGRSRGRRPARRASRRRPSPRRRRASPSALIRPRRSSTASTMATRAASSPLTARRGGGAAASRRDQRLHLGEQRAAALQRDGHAGARAPGRRAGTGTGRTGREARRCRRRAARSSRPRRPGRSGSWPPAPAAAWSAGRPRRTGPRRPGAPAARGPAIAPSLVTWPTRIVDMPRLLGDARSARRRPRGPGPRRRRCRRRRASATVWTESRISRRRVDRVEVAEDGATGRSRRRGRAVVQRADALGAQPDLAPRTPRP